jgi:hypothetical protein
VRLSSVRTTPPASDAQAMAYWSGAVLWDEYWSTLLAAAIPASNPSIGAKAYATHW